MQCLKNEFVTSSNPNKLQEYSILIQISIIFLLYLMRICKGKQLYIQDKICHQLPSILGQPALVTWIVGY